MGVGVTSGGYQHRYCNNFCLVTKQHISSLNFFLRLSGLGPLLSCRLVCGFLHSCIFRGQQYLAFAKYCEIINTKYAFVNV